MSSTKKNAKVEAKDAPARSVTRTTGRDIVNACKIGGIPAPKGAITLMNDGDLNKKALELLKDQIAECGKTLRATGDDGKRVCALALGHVLMTVQRLAREAK